MSINNIFGKSIGMMGKSLDYLWTKQKVTSNNIANAETPGYKSKYVTFEENFKSKLLEANTRIKENSSESARLDGNNVNTEVQMIELTRTALQYQYGIESVNKDFTRLGTAIKGQ
ncbi:flagellar basal-body rod protein FlgB [Aequitasia blattaphilus]|uniref:Flagellar basal body rod protein FlgB n=1 Tax=Aequitasia blattaphilus TaxID=2949332 RepID=A0ABT1ECD3_9FIRM|nr:flagellar basal body protein [Aequitasia blattaphilus]MCP1102501.1 flagellar basal body protein [Aequitasia blattaphilus]MCR8615141.1 flagellar basal body protein [Aequitasia blattaphilus]